jgi:polyhydroxyalkanoate synthase
MADRGNDADQGDVPPPRPPGPAMADPLAVGRTMADVAERSRRLVGDWLRRQVLDPAATGRSGEADPLNIGGAFMDMTARLMAHPAGLVQAQIGFWQDYLTLWQHTTRRFWGLDAPPVIEADAQDARFRDPAWKEEVFDFIKQSYLLSARYVQDVVSHVDGLSPRTAQKVDFYARQFVEAMSPSNFLLTNPEILRRTVETGGDNLLRGLSNLLMDLERGRGRLTIRLSELDAFRLGETVGITPGRVVFQNELLQLIQYSPATAQVLARPLMIVPDWTNKFYALDLRPRNSFVRWATAQGHTVFMLSWAAPVAGSADPTAVAPGGHRTPDLPHDPASPAAGCAPSDGRGGEPDDASERAAFEDYMRRGVLAGLEAILHLTGEREVNAVGVCLGGTLLAATLAAMARRGDRRIASLTLLTTMLDFAESGELGVFIDEGQLAALDAPPHRAAPRHATPHAPGAPALLPAGSEAERAPVPVATDRGGGPDHAAMLTLLRANDLIWSFVVNNYLIGQDPFPFDLLHWTCDAAPVPARLHGFYLRQLYGADQLARPGALTLLDVPIDLGRIDLPCYVLSARDDHIAPWRSVYCGARHLGGERRFVLAASGHFAGVVNPPESGRYSYWLGADLPPEPEAWFAGAVEMAGSWWPDWQRWVVARDRRTVPARLPGVEGEAAPGSFVRGHAA